MSNPWEQVPLNVYEAHMQLKDVAQLPALSRIMRKQLRQYPIETVAILGVAGGNGLEHIDPKQISRVYGIDINDQYLAACQKRFAHLQSCLSVMRLDLSDASVALPAADLYIANLLIEYTGVAAFVSQISRVMPRLVSCVIQKNANAPFVSVSPYREALSGLSDFHCDIDADGLTAGLCGAGYQLLLTEEYPLPGGKSLIRLDYAQSL